MRNFVLALALLAAPASTAVSQPGNRWLTDYEKSGYRETPRYAETIAFCKRLAAASPWVKYEPFGTSPQGRELPLVIVSRDRSFTPRLARASGKAIILIQSGIHAGEIDGKDASLMLIRDIAVTKQLRQLLDGTILLFVPIFNVDGHERFGRFNRINQNGPEEMGWRVTAQDLNLNRDYMKADAPEMRAMLRLFTSWLPDFYVDCHVTDGIDFQYDITYSIDTGPNVDPGVAEWVGKTLIPQSLPPVEASGHKIFYYVWPREDNDLSKGLRADASPARFSTGYGVLQNRPTLLIETHMLKPYRTRVDATYQLLKAMIAAINASPGRLREAVRKADAATIASGLAYDPRRTVPVVLGLGERNTTRNFLGFRSRRDTGEVSGSTYTISTGEPVTVSVPFYDDVTVLDSVTVPIAYVVPPEWTFVRDVLSAHGISLEQLTAPARIVVESYRFRDVSWAPKPYEGRQGATYKTETVTESRVYPAGSLIIRTAQRGAKVAIQLLEPRSQDSFVAWGFFNAIFEQKEYAEQYVMEGVGKKLLAEDPALREAFQSKLKTDSVFASRPSVRLNWLYLHSPWTDSLMNRYPVGRITSWTELRTRKL